MILMGSLPLLAAPAKGADKIAITGLAAGPAPFDPPAVPLTITTTFQVSAALVMGGGQGDQLTHHINATTSIKNAQGTTVRTLAGTTQVDVDAPATQGNDLVAVEVVVTWDGTDDQGRPVPDGNYGIQTSGTLVKKTTGADGEIRESAVSASEAATTTATLSFGEIAASITQFPPNPSNAASATFAFTVNVAGCTFERSLDGGPYVAATSPETLTNLAEGSHTYQVRAVGPTGVPDPSAASYSWTVDLTSPETTLTQTPPDPSNAASPAFAFSASEAGCTFERSLDGGEFVLATSPDTVGPLADGPHTITIEAAPPPPPPPPPVTRITLEMISGDGQNGLVNHGLLAPLIWKVVDADTGEAIQGVPATYDFLAGDGIFLEDDGYSSISDAGGWAGIRIVLGSQAGPVSVRVRAPDWFEADPLVFNLVATRPHVDLIEMGRPAPGDLQRPKYGLRIWTESLHRRRRPLDRRALSRRRCKPDHWHQRAG